MLFNSLEYLIFLPAVVVIYFVLPARRRWMLLLAASYFFYLSNRIEYGILILITTLVDYFVALKIHQTASVKGKKGYLAISLIANLGMLAGFKYLDFFSESVNLLLHSFHIQGGLPVFGILLPVGISFFIFKSLSYTIDVYRGLRTPEKHLGFYALYVSFFPQLISGPIDRSSSLLPQLHHPREFNTGWLISGLKLMLWGFFKKVVIADRLGLYVDEIYNNPEEYTGLSVILASVLFAFQLYSDFSGYTDIARGSARIMGYDLMINFNRPMIAKSLRDFWNRWHISLTTWFRDYVLYSLPYIRNKKVSFGRLYFNLIITYLLMGLWHGADWNFVIFGFLNGVFLVIETTTEKLRERFLDLTGISRARFFKNLNGNIITLSLIIFTLIFFRADSLDESFLIISNSFDFSNLSLSIRKILHDNELIFGILALVVMLVAEHIHEKHDLVRIIASRPIVIRWSVYIGFIFFILIFWVQQKQEFIYFQF
ncbi:MAG: MBOAT family protein [Bacteroidales bacterium]|nr:MBOAT family protein [Lentimicrobiaceae bacterium]MDD5695122.1 MBOAT family protein [Bacteroidales bacterium]